MHHFFARHGIFFALALLLCACASPPARLPPPPAEPNPLPTSAPSIPDTSLPPLGSTVTSPITPQSIIAPQPRAHVALVLPLASATFAGVAESVKQGFVAAATVEEKGALAYRIYAADSGAESLTANIRTALANGAVMVVGGLTRDGATHLARESVRHPNVPMLALNAPDASTSTRFFATSLALDLEARQVAQLAAKEGSRLAAVVHTNTGLAKRIQEAFEREWVRLGGEIVARIAASNDNEAAQAIRAYMENMRSDMVFIAADVNAARTVRPYIPIWMTTYATSLSVDARAEPVANVDLGGMRFLDMPWFVQPDHPAVMVYPRPALGISIESERLYALGIDAWRLAAMILKDGTAKPVLDGVTGRLTIESSNQISRTLTAAEFRDGRATPYSNPE